MGDTLGGNTRLKIPTLEKDKAHIMLAHCPELLTKKNITVVLVLKYI